MSSADFLIGLGLGLAVAAGSYVGLRWWLARSVARRALTLLPRPAARADGPTRAAIRVDDVPSPVAPVRTKEADPADLEAPTAAARSVAPADPMPSGPRGPEVEVLRVSQRVLIHLARHGSVDRAGEATTQRGIMSALGVTQGALSSVLRRLEDGGAIASDKVHLKGRDRRVKVYALTPRGRSLVAAAPRPAEPGAPPPPGSTRPAGGASNPLARALPPP